MPGGLVLHDAQLERARNEVAMANTARYMARNPYSTPLPPPDPNSQFMRKMKAATVERAIQAVEAQDRADNGETAKAYDRKKDYYQVLGIDKESSATEVRRAFRRLSLRYHPDKVAYKSDEEKAEAAAIFAALKEAHEVLSHEATRREYDQMLGVDDLLADKDSDLADIEAALNKVKEGLGKRRPPPTYYDVDVTLEELYTGCTKEVTHTKIVGHDAQLKEIVLKIDVPRGAVGGTEFLFKRMGAIPPGGAVPSDVIVVLREAEHEHLVRHGDELVHVHCREARAGELLLRLEVPTLFGRELSLMADTLAVQLLDEGDVATVRLPGFGMPHVGGERRQRYVNKGRHAGEQSPAKAGTAAGGGKGVGNGGAAEAVEAADEWQVEETSSAVIGERGGIDDDDDDEVVDEVLDEDEAEVGIAGTYDGGEAAAGIEQQGVAVAGPYGYGDAGGVAGGARKALSTMLQPGDEMCTPLDPSPHNPLRPCARVLMHTLASLVRLSWQTAT